MQVKNKIAQYGYNFSTHDLIHPKTTWADICFLGKNKNVYNATIMTTQCAWHDLVEHMVWEKLYSLVPKDHILFEIVELEGYTSNKEFSGPTTVSDPPLKELNNLTASQFIKEQNKVISKDKTITVHEEFKILPNFSFGIGLNMVVHHPNLTNEIIAQSIERFIQNGEKNWKSAESFGFEYEENVNFTTNPINL